MTVRDPVAHFYLRVVAGPNNCHLWVGGQKRGGYGAFRIPGGGGKGAVAHRWIWEQINGPVPDGMQLDHLCRVRNCVNLLHLEPVTPRENVMRGNTPAAINAAKTHCKYGHEFTDDNTIWNRGKRNCRTCKTAREKKRRRTPITPAELRVIDAARALANNDSDVPFAVRLARVFDAVRALEGDPQ